MIEIPWDKLGIPDALRGAVEPGAARSTRLAAAKGALPATADVLLGMLYALACGDDGDVRAAAVDTLRGLPGVANALTQRTHPKVLEFIATTRSDSDIDERIITIRGANDRTAVLIAGRADAKLAEIISGNHERLLLTPDVLVALHQNPACTDSSVERAIAFLRMHASAPDLPATRPSLDAPRSTRPVAAQKPAPTPPPEPVFDLEAEIAAALGGKPSPHLQFQSNLEMFSLANVKVGGLDAFAFDFKDDDTFSLDMLDEGDDDADVRLSLEKRIAAMSVGKKLKLAYLGNKPVRSILIRDRNKLVAVAVVKSGRLTDAEVLAYAGNRNLPDEALREIAVNKEWTRKYPVKVALANNPKCPPSVSVSLVSHLQGKDLASLARNRNVSSVVFGLAAKLAKQKNH